MAPVYRSHSPTTGMPITDGAGRIELTNPRFSALTSPGESLFMCSSKEGHVCYHACRGHGRYPLWSDEEFMVDDDATEEEPAADEREERSREDEVWESSDQDFDSDEEFLSSEARNEDEFWQQIQESVIRHRRREQREQERQRRIHYAATDLRFMLDDQESGSAMEHMDREGGPLVGVISSKPPPEYVWYLCDDNSDWMRGSRPERLSQQPDGAYHKYKYHVWDRIPAEDVRDSEDSEDDDEDDDDDDGSEGGYEAAPARSWSELADQQEDEELQTNQEVSWEAC